jgi:WD repeat and SOF domain-containing protein 1
VECAESAVLQFQGRHPFRAIDHHWKEQLFATAGAAVELWSHERSEPVNTFSWGADAVLSVRFNPVGGVRVRVGGRGGGGGGGWGGA